MPDHTHAEAAGRHDLSSCMAVIVIGESYDVRQSFSLSLRRMSMADSWIKRLINPHAMAGLFDEEPPLEDFEVCELRLERRGPSFFLHGELSTFPDHPRDGWESGADRLQVRFNLSSIDAFESRGSSEGGTVDLRIEDADDGFGVALIGDGDDLEFKASGIGLQVIGMKAY